MVTRSLRTFLTSAYLSAMLASSVAPIRSDATLATTIDPTAAQKALKTAFVGLNAAGWNVASVSSPAPVHAIPAGSPVYVPAANAPVMTEELMNRLFARALASQGDAILNMRITGLFGLNDGKTNLPAKQISILPERVRMFNVPLTQSRSDIVIIVKRGSVVEAYLTNKSGVLREAAIADSTGVRRVAREGALASYNAELAIFAQTAAALPPVANFVASK